MDRRTDMLPWRSPLVCRASRGVTTSIAKIRNGSTERTKHAWPPMYWVFMTYDYVYNTQHAPAAAAARQGREGEAASAAAQCYHGWLFPLDLHFFRSRLGVWVFFSAEKSGFS